MNTCKDCAWWVAKYKKLSGGDLGLSGESSGGTCSCGKFTENYGYEAFKQDGLVYPYFEGGHFWTGPEFGCVHHVERIR